MDHQDDLGLLAQAELGPDLESSELSSSEDYDSEFEDRNSTSRFCAAADAIKKTNGDFQSQEVLYDFLYKFRDVVGQSDPLLGSLLHVAIEVSSGDSKSQAEKTTPLIQSLLKDHPSLLGTVDCRGQTPLYMAICIGKYYMVESMINGCTKHPEWESSLRDAIEINCNEDMSNCLHAAFRKDLRSKTIKKLIRFSSNETLLAQDHYGMTPVHYAVDYTKCTESRKDLVALFIARDESIRPGASFLDLVNSDGLSVYRQHVLSRSTYEEKVTSKELESLQDFEPATSKKSPQMDALKVSHLKTSLESNTSDPEDLDNPSDANTKDAENTHLDPGKSPDNHVDSPHQPQSQSTEEENRRKIGHTSPWHKRHDRRILHRNSGEMLDRLKLHYMRTRDSEMVLTFLYGNNKDDVQIAFDYHGLPTEFSTDDFLRGFRRMVFDEVLQYVAFPRDVKVSRDSQKTIDTNRNAGMGRGDLEFFFRWLRQQKKVRHIIHLQVDDKSMPCHSDEAIVSCLQGITVDHIDWQKFDMDPQTFSRLEDPLAIRELSLQWSGRNAVLRAWSEPEGLPMLEGLRKINIHIAPSDQLIDSQDCIQVNLREFEVRLLQNVKKHQRQQENNVTIHVRRSMSEKERSARYERTSGMGRPAAAQIWLESVNSFAKPISRYHSKLRSHEKNDGTQGSQDAIVAVIDDGFDITDPSISDRIVGGRSFCHDGIRTAPYWASGSGHGTIMARTILKVCPKAKLYCIRLQTILVEDQERVHLTSAAAAIQAALDRKAAVISMSLPVLIIDRTVHARVSLENVLAKARDSGVIMFCCAPEDATTADYYPVGYRPDTFFRIGQSRTDGKHDGPRQDIDFVFPGIEDASRGEFIPPASGDTNDIDTAIPGSSIATARGAGLAALIIQCFEILESQSETFFSDGEAQDLKWVHESLKTHRGMLVAFHNLGTVTEHKFINLWETFRPVTRVFQNSSRSDEERFQCLKSFCLTLGTQNTHS